MSAHSHTRTHTVEFRYKRELILAAFALFSRHLLGNEGRPSGDMAEHFHYAHI